MSGTCRLSSNFEGGSRSGNVDNCRKSLFHTMVTMETIEEDRQLSSQISQQTPTGESLSVSDGRFRPAGGHVTISTIDQRQTTDKITIAKQTVETGQGLIAIGNSPNLSEPCLGDNPTPNDEPCVATGFPAIGNAPAITSATIDKCSGGNPTAVRKSGDNRRAGVFESLENVPDFNDLVDYGNTPIKKPNQTSKDNTATIGLNTPIVTCKIHSEKKRKYKSADSTSPSNTNIPKKQKKRRK